MNTGCLPVAVLFFFATAAVALSLSDATLSSDQLFAGRKTVRTHDVQPDPDDASGTLFRHTVVEHDEDMAHHPYLVDVADVMNSLMDKRVGFVDVAAPRCLVHADTTRRRIPEPSVFLTLPGAGDFLRPLYERLRLAMAHNGSIVDSSGAIDELCRAESSSTAGVGRGVAPKAVLSMSAQLTLSMEVVDLHTAGSSTAAVLLAVVARMVPFHRRFTASNGRVRVYRTLSPHLAQFASPPAALTPANDTTASVNGSSSGVVVVPVTAHRHAMSLGDSITATCATGATNTTCDVTWSVSCSWGATGTWGIELYEGTSSLFSTLVQRWPVTVTSGAKTVSSSMKVSTVIFLTSKFYFSMDYDCSFTPSLAPVSTSSFTITGTRGAPPAVTFPTKNYIITLSQSYYVRWTPINSSSCPTPTNVKLTDTCSGVALTLNTSTLFNGSMATSLGKGSDCSTSTFKLSFSCGGAGYPSTIIATSAEFNIYGQDGLAFVSPVAFQAMKPTDKVNIQLVRTGKTFTGFANRKLQLVRGAWFWDPLSSITGSNVIYEWPTAINTSQAASNLTIDLSVITDWKLSETITNPQYNFVVVDAIVGTIIDKDIDSLPFFVQQGSYGASVDVSQTLVDVTSDDAASYCEGPFDGDSIVTNIFGAAICSKLDSGIDLESVQIAFTLALDGNAQAELGLSEFYWQTSGTYTFAVEADASGELALVADMAVSVEEIVIDIPLPVPIGFEKSVEFTVLSSTYSISINCDVTLSVTVSIDATATATIPLPILRSFTVALQNVDSEGTDQIESPFGEFNPLTKPSFSGALDVTVNVILFAGLTAAFSSYISVEAHASLNLEVMAQLRYPPFPPSNVLAPTVPVCTNQSHFVELSVSIGFNASASATLNIPLLDPSNPQFGQVSWSKPIYASCYLPGTMTSLLQQSASVTGHLTLPSNAPVENATARIALAFVRALQENYTNVSLATLQVIQISSGVAERERSAMDVGSSASTVQVTVFDTSGELTSDALDEAAASPAFSLGSSDYGFSAQPPTPNGQPQTTTVPLTPGGQPQTTTVPLTPGGPSSDSTTAQPQTPGITTQAPSGDSQPITDTTNASDSYTTLLIAIIIPCVSAMLLAALALALWKCNGASGKPFASPLADMAQNLISVNDVPGPMLVELVESVREVAVDIEELNPAISVTVAAVASVVNAAADAAFAQDDDPIL